MTDSTQPPRVTGDESLILDMIDRLAALAGPAETADPDTAVDALDESQAAEQRLAAAREASWLRWAHDQRDADGRSMFDIYDETERDRGKQ